MSKSEAKVIKREPIGSQREPKRSPKGAKGSQNGAKMEPKSDQNASKNQASEKVAKRSILRLKSGSILGAIFDQKSKKWHPKRHPKIDVEKASKNDAKRLPK